jgi:hypothetical protein
VAFVLLFHECKILTCFFFPCGEQDGIESKSLKGLGLTKGMVQQRANQLVRELHAVEESEDTLRLIEERRNRAAAKKQGFDRSLAECHTNKSKSSGKNSPKGGGIQTGLHAFFVSSKSGSKKQKVIVLSDDEEAIPSSESILAGKRKDSPASSDEGCPVEKKVKKTAAFLQVVPGKRKDDGTLTDASTPEKKLRTVVNADGVIELISVPK